MRAVARLRQVVATVRPEVAKMQAAPWEEAMEAQTGRLERAATAATEVEAEVPAIMEVVVRTRLVELEDQIT